MKTEVENIIGEFSQDALWVKSQGFFVTIYFIFYNLKLEGARHFFWKTLELGYINSVNSLNVLEVKSDFYKNPKQLNSLAYTGCAVQLNWLSA